MSEVWLVSGGLAKAVVRAGDEEEAIEKARSSGVYGAELAFSPRGKIVPYASPFTTEVEIVVMPPAHRLAGIERMVEER